MSVHRVPKAGNGSWRVIHLALRSSEASFWPPGSKDCCFMIRLPLEFRQSYVMAWVVGTVFYAWMFWCFIEKGYVQVCFMLCSLRPYTCESWTIKFVSPLEAVPECPLQSAALWALQVWGKAHNKKNFRDTGILYILIWVRESPIYTCIKIHQAVHLRFVCISEL